MLEFVTTFGHATYDKMSQTDRFVLTQAQIGVSHEITKHNIDFAIASSALCVYVCFIMIAIIKLALHNPTIGGYKQE